MEFYDRLPNKVNKWAKKTPMFLDYEELHSLCTMGLIDAAKHYIPIYKGFWGYASIRIDGYIKDWMRREDWVPRTDRKKWKVSEGDFEIHQQLHLEVIKDTDMYQRLGCIDDRFRMVDNRDQLRKLMRGFSNKEQRFVHMYVVEGYTLRECGIIMGLSESRMCQIWESILKFARRIADGT